MSTMATRSYSTVPFTPAPTTSSVVVGDGQFGLPLARQMVRRCSARVLRLLTHQPSLQSSVSLPLAHAPSFASVDMVAHGLEVCLTSPCFRRTLLITVSTMQLVRHEEMVQQLSPYQAEYFQEHDIAIPAHHKVITSVRHPALRSGDSLTDCRYPVVQEVYEHSFDAHHQHHLEHQLVVQHD